MVKGLECVSVVDSRMHLDKISISFYAMIGYEIITRLIQDTCSLYNNEYP
jgi:hypothetical protein